MTFVAGPDELVREVKRENYWGFFSFFNSTDDADPKLTEGLLPTAQAKEQPRDSHDRQGDHVIRCSPALLARQIQPTSTGSWNSTILFLFT